ncbi:MAG: MFS transporter [Micrococcales bacterium]|nr:MFS transporter [Micrococcales bacterium]MCL2668124.1 MFS transporter [Micrococcales bacterium]
MSAAPTDSSQDLRAGAGGDNRLVYLKGRWIDNWDPENEEQWEREGSKIARTNLGFSIYAEFLGFVVWQLWSIVVVQLQVKPDGSPGPFGFAFTSSEAFWLISLPSLVGATLRFPYTFMVAKIGGRNWTIISAALLLIPTTALSLAISNNPVDGQGGTSYHTMLLVAALGGFGGGNFASSMANITFFFPQRTKGWALGLNAAGGNIGAAIAQFTVPILVSVTALVMVTADGEKKVTPNLPIAGWFWIPLIVMAMGGAIWGMHNLTSAKTDFGGYKAALKDPHLWWLSLLYIGTFGSFIGLAGAFPKLLADTFTSYSTLKIPIAGTIATVGLAFMGPLVGSLIRPLGGRLADKFGGAYITVIAFGSMILAAFCAIQVLSAAREARLNDARTAADTSQYTGIPIEDVATTEAPPTYFWLFLLCFLGLFVATGIGNGSMYKMIPTVFAHRAGVADAQRQSAGISTERKTSAALGIVSAFGAYGGFLVPQLFNRTLEMNADNATVVGTVQDSVASVSTKVVDGYQLGLWWLLGAYVVFLIILVALYVVPYIGRGTRV